LWFCILHSLWGCGVVMLCLSFAFQEKKHNKLRFTTELLKLSFCILCAFCHCITTIFRHSHTRNIQSLPYTHTNILSVQFMCNTGVMLIFCLWYSEFCFMHTVHRIRLPQMGVDFYLQTQFNSFQFNILIVLIPVHA